MSTARQSAEAIHVTAVESAYERRRDPPGRPGPGDPMGRGPGGCPPARVPAPDARAAPVAQPQRVVALRRRRQVRRPGGRVSRGRVAGAHPRAVRGGDQGIGRGQAPRARRAAVLRAGHRGPRAVAGRARRRRLRGGGPRVPRLRRRRAHRLPHGRVLPLPRGAARHGAGAGPPARRSGRRDRHDGPAARQAVAGARRDLVHGHIGHLADRVDGAPARPGDHPGAHPHPPRPGHRGRADPRRGRPPARHDHHQRPGGRRGPGVGDHRSAHRRADPFRAAVEPRRSAPVLAGRGHWGRPRGVVLRRADRRRVRPGGRGRGPRAAQRRARPGQRPPCGRATGPSPV